MKNSIFLVAKTNNPQLTNRTLLYLLFLVIVGEVKRIPTAEMVNAIQNSINIRLRGESKIDTSHIEIYDC